jgi:hypothetical protein
MVLAAGNWRQTTGNWEHATGYWKLETGNWRLVTENCLIVRICQMQVAKSQPLKNRIVTDPS